MTNLVMSYFLAEDGLYYGFDDEQVASGLSDGMTRISLKEVNGILNPVVSPAIGERSWRDGELKLTDEIVSRHRDEIEGGGVTTLTPDEYKDLQAYRTSLRDWPGSAGFPKSEKRPIAPALLAAKISK